MSAIAHGWKPTGSAAGIPVKVAKDFHAADKAEGHGGHEKKGLPKRAKSAEHQGAWAEALRK